MSGCVTVDLGRLWTGATEGIIWAVGVFLFVGGLIGIWGWKRPSRMAWLHNKLMLGLSLLISVPAGFLALMGSISPAFSVAERCVEAGQWWWRFLDPNSDWNTAIVVLPTAAAVILASVYFFKAARPAFLVKRTGKRAVDEVIEWYRGPGERVVVGRPRLVVDGVGYYQAVYLRGEGEGAQGEPLLVREDGRVVSDEGLARRVMRVADAAFELGEPEAIMERYELYRKMRKLEGELERMVWMRPKDERRLRERYMGLYPEYERLMGSVEVFLGYIQKLKGDLERLAEWSWEKKGPKMEELWEEEVERMEGELEAIRYWWEDEGRVKLLERGREAAQRLMGALEALEGEGARMREKDGDLWWGLWDTVEPWVEVMAGYEAIVKKGGGMRRRWFEVGEEDIASWRRRLRRGRGAPGG